MNSDTEYFDGGKTKQKRSLKLRPGGTTQICSVLLLLLLTFAEHPPPLECSVDRADRSSPCSPRFARAICFPPVVSPTSAGLKWVLITVLIDARALGPFENRPTATACISTPSRVRHDISRHNYAGERTGRRLLCSTTLLLPTLLSRQPGFHLPHHTWSLMNRFRTGQGPCHANLHKWGLAQSPSCDCGQRQTINHIVDTCPLTTFEGVLNLLHEADEDAFIIIIIIIAVTMFMLLS